MHQIGAVAAHTWRGSLPALSGHMLLWVWFLLVGLLVRWRLASSCLLGRKCGSEAHVVLLL
jgi:hypothetical protein